MRMLHLFRSGSAAAVRRSLFKCQWSINPSLFSSATGNIIPGASLPPRKEDENERVRKNEKKFVMLDVEEVEKILNDVKAGDVSVIPISSSDSESSGLGSSSWTDFMVVATGRSPWHVRNIAQALIHRVKEKQKGTELILLPRVQGYQEGKWVIVDSGNVVIHALDEKARSYYNLEELLMNRASKRLCEENPATNFLSE